MNLPSEPSNENAFRSRHAHEHRSQVVSPSEEMLSSRKGGRGGGGTKRPLKRPPSLPSKGNGELKVSSSIASAHQSTSDVRLIESSSWDAEVNDDAPSSEPLGFGTLGNIMRDLRKTRNGLLECYLSRLVMKSVRQSVNCSRFVRRISCCACRKHYFKLF